MTWENRQNEQPALREEALSRFTESSRRNHLFLVAACVGVCAIIGLWLLSSWLYRNVTSVVEVTIRLSLVIDKTAVVRLRNTSRQVIRSVIVEFRRPATGDSVTSTVGMIAPDETQEVGFLQSRWKLEPNEQFTVKADGFGSATFRTYAGNGGQVSLSP